MELQGLRDVFVRLFFGLTLPDYPWHCRHVPTVFGVREHRRYEPACHARPLLSAFADDFPRFPIILW
jgi:hypothetical protein